MEASIVRKEILHLISFVLIQLQTNIHFSINVCLLKFESHQNTRKTATFCEFSQNWIRIITTTQRFQSLLNLLDMWNYWGLSFSCELDFYGIFLWTAGAVKCLSPVLRVQRPFFSWHLYSWQIAIALAKLIDTLMCCGSKSSQHRWYSQHEA